MASMDGGPRKRPKSAKVDRISSLPDDVLSLILSLIPTKSAVQTSILSKRWKYVWTFITSLHFEGPNDKFIDSTPKRHFRKFVDHVFHCCNSPRIDKFVLHLYPNYLGKRSRVFAWVDEAIKRNVSELDISVSKLPFSVFTCRTLTVLTLCPYDYPDRKTVSFDLPCLKVLFIKGNGLLRQDVMQKLISSCPVLEHLILGGCLLSLNTFMVSSLTLKTLDLQPSQRSWFSSSTEISVEAPNLEYLLLNERFVNFNIKGDLSLLGKASVNIGSTFQGMPSRFKLPNFFSNLTCLELITRDKRFWEMLPKLIRSSPKLQVLSLEQYGGYDQVKSYYTWVEPKAAAKCLGHHLEVIQIKGFKGAKHELQLLKYFLGSAKVLRTLTINCQGLKREEEINFFGEVLKFSRASKCCEVQFHGDLISN